MPAPYCYEYPRPAVTVDLAAFARSGDGLRVLLIRRKKEPFAGRLALPGGFLEIDEPVEAAARRELKEETGLEVAGRVEFLGVWGEPGRDPRGRTISLVHAAVLPGEPPDVAGGDDAEEATWLDPFAAANLAFDHDDILQAALGWLARQFGHGTAALTLLPPAFGEDDVRSLFESARVGDTPPADWLERMTRAGRIALQPGDAARYRAT